MTATRTAAVATTSDSQIPREHWQRTPHPYTVDYPKYPCARCGYWPGYPIHDAPAGAGDPDPVPVGHEQTT